MENGYDLCDPRYMQWLQIFHPEEAKKLAAAPRLGSSCTNEAPVTSSGVKSQSTQHPSACSLVDKVSRPVNSQPTSHDKVHAKQRSETSRQQYPSDRGSFMSVQAASLTSCDLKSNENSHKYPTRSSGQTLPAHKPHALSTKRYSLRSKKLLGIRIS